MSPTEIDTNKREGKRKKDSIPKLIVSPFDLTNPKLVPIFKQFGVEGYGIYILVRGQIRAQHELNICSTDVEALLSWTLRIDQERVNEIIHALIASDALVWTDEARTRISCPLVLEDVEVFDERRQQLSKAGKESARKRQEKIQQMLNTRSTRSVHTKERKGRDRIGKVSKEVDPNSPPNWIRFREGVQPQDSDGLIWLTDEEGRKLRDELGMEQFLDLYQQMCNYALSNPTKWKKKYEDHAAVMRSWKRRRDEGGKAA